MFRPQWWWKKMSFGWIGRRTLPMYQESGGSRYDHLKGSFWPVRAMIAKMASSVMARTGYTHKPGPYSSHTLLGNSLEPRGNGKRLLDVGCASGLLAGLLAQPASDWLRIHRPPREPT